MNRNLRALFPLAILAASAPSLMADVTMRITGKVTTKDGKPIPGAKLVIKKVDNGWMREILTDSNGIYSQAGLQPDLKKNYEITISKDGYSTHVKRISVILQGSSFTEPDFILYAPGEAPLPDDEADFAPAAGTASSAADPALKEDADARAAFNAAVPLYQAKNYAGALPNLEKAYTGMTHAVATMKDEAAKTDSQSLLPSVGKAYGLALHQVGKDDDAIAPLSSVVDADPKNKGNADAMMALVDIYTKKKDDANKAKYQSILSAATGISPADAPYSDAAKAFNAGHMKEAKQFLAKAIAADASYADSYYLSGLIAYGDGNMAAVKTNFKKYLELAPTGKHAEEIKEMGF